MRGATRDTKPLKSISEYKMLTEKNGYVCDYDRPIAVTFYVDDEGLRQGEYRTYHINDNKERIGAFQIFHYVAGELHGRFEAYDIDGKLLEEGSYSNGRLQGVFREYVGGKLIVQCYYNNDLLHGKFTKWRNVDTGVLEYTMLYKDGVPQQLMGFDENSVIKRVISYDGGVAVEESEYKRTTDHIYLCKRTRDYYCEEIIV